MVRVQRHTLAEVRSPKLEAALKRWYQLCGSGGLYPRDDLGFGVLIGSPEIMNGRSAVVATDVDDPLNFVVAFYGGEFNVYENKSLVARRFRDFPDRGPAEAMVRCYLEAISERQPTAHRIAGSFGGVDLTYDRLILPTINKDGVVDRLVTLSEEVSREL